MAHRFDDISPDTLRALGWKKWLQFGDQIGAWVAEADFGTAPSVQRVLRRAADGAGLGYLPTSSYVDLQRAFTGFVADRFAWHVDPEDVRAVTDVLSAMRITLEHFSPAGPVVLPTPAYMPFAPLISALGREVVEVPLLLDGGQYRYDIDAIDAAFAAGAGTLILCNPHNPVGRVLQREELAAISEVVQRHGARVFADEIHAALTFDDHHHIPYATISEAAAAHTITAMSASKAFNVPGLKCAQVVLSNDADRRLWRSKTLLFEDPASPLGALVATAAYADGGDWLDEVTAYLHGNRTLLTQRVAAMEQVSYLEPEGTYLAWLDVRATGLADPAAYLREHAGVALTNGTACGAGGQGFVRLTFATPAPVLTQILDGMEAAFGRL